jgi:ABC-type transporter Mla subunit MlaD
MGTELRVRLTTLAAPGPLLELAQPYPDLKSCWNACQSPELLLWLAARLSTTPAERRAVVACLAELTRRAERGTKHLNPRVEQASVTAETWARAGASLDDLLAAERAALEAAASAAAAAAEEMARARALFRSAPRSRPASFSNSRAFSALADWREADRARRLALAAAGTARAAAEAARADAGGANAGGANARGAIVGGANAGGDVQAPAQPDAGPGNWEASVGESASYLISALAHSRPARRDQRAERKAAKLVRRRLPCPTFD